MYKIPANTLFVGKNLVYVPVCHSTNTLAAELGNKTPLLEGTLIITDNQKAGRGQRGNGWEAEPFKNFTLSLIVKPTFLPVVHQFLLNQCISLAIADFIYSLIEQEVKIKWPNDILVGDSKVCGTLIENSLNGNSIQQSIIGIGLNVNQRHFEFPQATSLFNISQKEYALSGILHELLGCIEMRYLQLKREEWETIQEDYTKRLYRINETHWYRDSDKEFEGVIVGIDKLGRLKIRAEEDRVFDVKQVKFLNR